MPWGLMHRFYNDLDGETLAKWCGSSLDIYPIITIALAPFVVPRGKVFVSGSKEKDDTYSLYIMTLRRKHQHWVVPQ